MQNTLAQRQRHAIDACRYHCRGSSWRPCCGRRSRLCTLRQKKNIFRNIQSSCDFDVYVNQITNVLERVACGVDVVDVVENVLVDRVGANYNKNKRI